MSFNSMRRSRGSTVCIASIAFMTRVEITCCNCTGSHSTRGRPSSSAVCSSTPFFCSSTRTISSTVRISLLISIEGLSFEILLEHRPDAAHDFGRAIACVDDLAQHVAYFFDIRRLLGEPARRGARARRDAGERLIHFVRDRGRQFTGRRDAVHVHQLGHAGARRNLGDAAAAMLIEQHHDHGGLNQDRGRQQKNLPAIVLPDCRLAKLYDTVRRKERLADLPALQFTPVVFRRAGAHCGRLDVRGRFTGEHPHRDGRSLLGNLLSGQHGAADNAAAEIGVHKGEDR